MTRHCPSIVVRCLLLVACAASGCGQPRNAVAVAQTTAGTESAGALPPIRVSFVQPVRKTLQRVAEQPGWIEAFERAPIQAKVSGYVGEVKVDIGQPVKEGDVLAVVLIPELDAELKQKQAAVEVAEAGVGQAKAAEEVAESEVLVAEARLNEARASIDRTQAEFERWESELERISELAAKAAVTRKLEDETRSQWKAADAARREAASRVVSGEADWAASKSRLTSVAADLKAAEAKVRLAQADRDRVQALVDYAQVRAPFDGAVTERNVSRGHFLQSATAADARPMFVVLRTDIVRVFADVPELESALVDSGDTAVIRVQALGDEALEGPVTRTAVGLDTTSRTLRTEIDLENPSGRLRPGMYVHVGVIAEERPDALVLPVAAVFKEGGQAYCACITRGKIERRKLQVGLRAAGELEVIDGLRGSEQVVAKNASVLAVGQAVEGVPVEGVK